jgi:hypothetical protein
MNRRFHSIAHPFAQKSQFPAHFTPFTIAQGDSIMATSTTTIPTQANGHNPRTSQAGAKFQQLRQVILT